MTMIRAALLLFTLVFGLGNISFEKKDSPNERKHESHGAKLLPEFYFVKIKHLLFVK